MKYGLRRKSSKDSVLFFFTNVTRKQQYFLANDEIDDIDFIDDRRIFKSSFSLILEIRISEFLLPFIFSFTSTLCSLSN